MLTIYNMALDSRGHDTLLAILVTAFACHGDFADTFWTRELYLDFGLRTCRPISSYTTTVQCCKLSVSKHSRSWKAERQIKPLDLLVMSEDAEMSSVTLNSVHANSAVFLVASRFGRNKEESSWKCYSSRTTAARNTGKRLG